MKRIIALSILLLSFSCEYFNKKKVDADTLLNEELKTFNWNDVDTFPSFEVCQNSTEKEDSKKCFENTLSQHILTTLRNSSLVSSSTINDTIYVDFIISEKGEISSEHIAASELIKVQFPNLDSLIVYSLETLPNIFPAVKRGQQVRSQFKLPIVVKTN